MTMPSDGWTATRFDSPELSVSLNTGRNSKARYVSSCILSGLTVEVRSVEAKEHTRCLRDVTFPTSLDGNARS